MRILSGFAGGRGHFDPMAPIARASVDAGHTIAFTCQQSMIQTVRDAGFEAWQSGPDFDGGGTRHPLLEPDAQREDNDLREGFVRNAARLRATGVLSHAKSWRPDVIMCDEVDFGAMIAAEVLGIPHVTVLSNAAGSFVRYPVIGEALNELRVSHGLAPEPDLRMMSRHLVLSPFPPGFRDPGYPLPANGYTIRTQDVAEADGETIYFTLGTIFNTESGDLLGRVLSGLSSLNVPLVMTVGAHIDPAEFGPQPSHVTIERFIPQATVLPQCRLVVSHGGSGSLTGTIRHGLPTVLIPLGADQLVNAERCVDLGLGKVLNAVTVTPDEVAEAASAVLGDPSYRAVSRGLRDELAAQPDSPYAVKLIEGLG
ncbi:UDP:flavonoid glycosyltransferase YjiC (YdhE family) [Kibdelosporangium banguiense]|uniref:UDP:flavonoid glycosyltransferase YjiC (YdhE family) n=1 Tax=Kibdelosporangium banguiense TaxID=1365924 RepID=A0ABS4T785_9PSEU|nr:glycosyltransferase [Kibdelosporangium banguiense]MBP2320275.1 UDP:flavonoid glycosyltransferase YjiC (YdhE family) [Kibdelosporangium banguiense]